MQDLPLNALRAFAMVHAHRGVRSAARELGIAHSALSRHLRELEAWLGISLIHPSKGRNGAALTPAGASLGRAVLSSLEDIEQAVSVFREARGPNSVTVSTTPSVAVRWLLPRLHAFDEEQPRIEVSVVAEQRLEDSAMRDVDIAIRMGRGPWRDVVSEPLMGDLLYPVMSPAHWKKLREPRKPSDLQGVRLIHDRDPNASWAAWREAHGPAGLNIRGGPRYTSSDMVLRAAARGLGVALARHRLAADDLANGTLVRPIGDLSVSIDRAYWIVRPGHGRPRPAVTKFIEWLRAQAATTDGAVI